MNKVIVDMGMSLDGFIAEPNAGPHNTLGDGVIDSPRSHISDTAS